MDIHLLYKVVIKVFVCLHFYTVNFVWDKFFDDTPSTHCVNPTEK